MTQGTLLIEDPLEVKQY